MATVQAVVFKHHKKADGTYNVKIRITLNREKKYIDTQHYVKDYQLTKSLETRDYEIKKEVEDQQEILEGLTMQFRRMQSTHLCNLIFKIISFTH